MEEVKTAAFATSVPPFWFTITIPILYVAPLLVIMILSAIQRRLMVPFPRVQATRDVQRRRAHHILIFTLLAIISYMAAIYLNNRVIQLSYGSWAHDRGLSAPYAGSWRKMMQGQEEIDARLSAEDFSEKVITPGFRLFDSWRKDVSLLSEFWEIPFETTGRRWWAQQLVVATGAWSVYVAVEGRRRSIQYIWCYLALAPLTSLAFAVNVFFIAVLWTPVETLSAAAAAASMGTSERRSPTPIASRKASTRSRSRSRKSSVLEVNATGRSILHRYGSSLERWIHFIFTPSTKLPTWSPSPLLHILPSVILLLCTTLAPHAADTPSFVPIFCSLYILIFSPYLLTVFSPYAFGKLSCPPWIAKARSSIPFRVIANYGFLLHVVQTAIALAYNDPGSYRHRHMHYMTYFRGRNPLLVRAQTSLGQLLGALREHPSVARIGWDVLLTGLSIVIWAGLKGSRKRAMLNALSLSNGVVEVKGAGGKRKVIRSSSDAANGLERKMSRRGSTRKKERKSVGQKEDAPERLEPVETIEGNEWARRIADDEKDTDWESSGLALGLTFLGGIGTGSACVLGAEVGA